MSAHPSLFGVLREAIRSRDPVTKGLRPSAFERAVYAWIGDGAGARRPSSSLMLIALDWQDGGPVGHRPAHRRATTTLAALADEVRGCIRATDILGRISDDTLGVLLPSTPAEQAQLVADRIRASAGAIHTAGGAPLTVSIGIATGLAPNPWVAAWDALGDAQLDGGDEVIVARRHPLRQRATGT